MSEFRLSDDKTEVAITLYPMQARVGQLRVDAFTSDRTGSFWRAVILAGQPTLTEYETESAKADVQRTAAGLVENRREEFDAMFGQLR
jgi:hypothetical protein